MEKKNYADSRSFCSISASWPLEGCVCMLPRSKWGSDKMMKKDKKEK